MDMRESNRKAAMTEPAIAPAPLGCDIAAVAADDSALTGTAVRRVDRGTGEDDVDRTESSSAADVGVRSGVMVGDGTTLEVTAAATIVDVVDDGNGDVDADSTAPTNGGEKKTYRASKQNGVNGKADQSSTCQTSNKRKEQSRHRASTGRNKSKR